MTILRKVIFLVTVLILLTNCSNKLDNPYKYTKPGSIVGMHCVNQCQAAKANCDKNCLSSRQSVVSQNIQEKKRSLQDQNYRPVLQPEDGDCGCLAEYNACYTSCGGNVN